MGAVGLDTSVVVRFLTGEPEPLAQEARRRIAEALQDGHELVVADIAVVEAYYVLHKVFGIPKRASIRALIDLLVQPGFRPQTGGVALTALKAAASTTGAKPGMVDRMLHARYIRECGSMLTFERAARKLDRVEVLG